MYNLYMAHRTLKNPCFVYVHRRLDNNKIFYVGKGSSRKRCFSKSGRNIHWHRVADKHGFIVEIVLCGLTNEQACQLEIELIAFYGMENLTNKTTGGEGAPGVVIGENQRLHMSKLFKGIKPSDSVIKAAIQKNSKPIGTVCGLRFESVTKAAEHMVALGFEKASKACIHSCLSGKSSHAYGFDFRYLLNDGGLAEAKFKRAEFKKIINDSGDKFDNIQHAARWCISNGLTGSKDVASCSSNIAMAIYGNKGAVYAFGFRWKHDDANIEFRKKEERKGSRIERSDGLIFVSIAQAAREMMEFGFSKSYTNQQITSCCKGIQEKAFGFGWRYLDDSTS